MPLHFIGALILLAIASLVLLFVSDKFMQSNLLHEWEAGDHGDAIKFQRNWLLVYAMVQLAQWIQTPYLFRLYASYSFAHSEIVTFFLLTYASSALIGTVVGAAADRCGRKKMCYLFLTLFSFSTLLKYDQPSFTRVAIAHLIDGIALSLLYTSFEAWMVSENFASCFPQSHLHRTFELGSILNGAIAVVAGIFANVATSVGSDFGPFWCSLIPIVVAGVLMKTWSENYGEVAGSTSTTGILSSLIPYAVFKRDNKIILLGLAQTFFDSAMYVVRYAWMPAMASTKSNYPQSYGIVFAALMISVMIGGILFSMARRSVICVNSTGGDGYGTGNGGTTSFARVALPAHLLAAVCLVGTVVMFDNGPGNSSTLFLFWCFIGVEMCYGYWWPCYGVMRSAFIPETHRSTVMNIFLIPRNVVVASALIYNSYLSTLSSTTKEIVQGAAGAVVGTGVVANNMTKDANSNVVVQNIGTTFETTFETTLQQGHLASRELLIVGIISFGLSLFFAIVLHQKTKISSPTIKYQAISLDESNVTNEFEDDFGDLVDDFDMYNDKNNISQSSSLRREEDSFFNDDDDDPLNDNGFDGF
jgi:hypothetical protein